MITFYTYLLSILRHSYLNTLLIIILFTREAKAIKLKSGSKVQVSAVREGSKEVIVIEKFSIVEE
jgi:hypothetical protein